MFEWLRMQNFQSHRDTLIEFHEGVNVITGISLHGKTAIARGTGLLIYNRPLGAKYYSNFAPDKGTTAIELKTKDHPVISLTKTVNRKKDGSKELVENGTTYTYDGESYSSLPDQIQDALNISELNIQKQFASPFLILSSGGEFARIVNRITKLEKVEVWISELKTRINKTKNEVDLLETQATDFEKQLTKYVGFEDLSVQVKYLQEVDASLTQAQSQLSRLNDLLAKVEDIEDELDRIQPALAIENDIQVLIDLEQSIISIDRQVVLIEKAKTIDNGITQLQSITILLTRLESMVETEEKFNRLDSILARVESIDDEIEDKKKLLSDLQKLEGFLAIENRMALLKSYIELIEGLNNSIEDKKIAYNNEEQQLMKELANVKECPVFLTACPVTKEMMGKSK